MVWLQISLEAAFKMNYLNVVTKALTVSRMNAVTLQFIFSDVVLVTECPCQRLLNAVTLQFYGWSDVAPVCRFVE